MAEEEDKADEIVFVPRDLDSPRLDVKWSLKHTHGYSGVRGTRFYFMPNANTSLYYLDESECQLQPIEFADNAYIEVSDTPFRKSSIADMIEELHCKTSQTMPVDSFHEAITLQELQTQLELVGIEPWMWTEDLAQQVQEQLDQHRVCLWISDPDFKILLFTSVKSDIIRELETVQAASISRGVTFEWI